MTTRDEVLTLDGAGELLETLPYLLGFHPDASLVLVGLHDKRVVVTTRVDLADASDRIGRDTDVHVLLQAGATAAVIVVYAAAADPAMRSLRDVPLPHQDAVDFVAGALSMHELAVVDALFVQADRWWSYPGRASGCPCCIDGDPLPGDAATGPAEAVFAGLQARSSRAALQAVLDPDSDEVRRTQRAGIRAAERSIELAAADGFAERELRSLKRALFAAARDADRALFPRSALAVGPAVLCRFAVGLRDIAIRDAVWLAVDQGRLDGRALWLQLLQRLPPPYDSAPLFLFGWATWREGNGTLAAMAAERALDSDPDCSAADLLLSAIRAGLDPHRTPRLRAASPDDVSRRARTRGLRPPG